MNTDTKEREYEWLRNFITCRRDTATYPSEWRRGYRAALAEMLEKLDRLIPPAAPCGESGEQGKAIN